MALLSLPRRLTYVLFTTFHMEMYFSMQFDRHVLSLDDSEVPGFGTQASKQWVLTLWNSLDGIVPEGRG